MAGSAGVIVGGAAGTAGVGGVAGVSGTAGTAGTVSAGGDAGGGGVTQVGGSAGQGGVGGVGPIGGGAGLAGMAGVAGFAGPGGAAGGGGMAGTAGVAFWTAPYESSSGPADGHHNEGTACMGCHPGAGGGQAFAFAGTVYQPSGNTGAADVEIGVRVGGQLYTTYSAVGGNFWLLGNAIADWSGAEVLIRNATAESIMLGTQGPPSADCNGASCHTGTTDQLREPS